jgi:hypothetical protein
LELFNKYFIPVFLSSEELREHFHTYGEIESINVKTDPNTGRSRGFAFIVFSHADSIDKVLFNLLVTPSNVVVMSDITWGRF